MGFSPGADARHRSRTRVWFIYSIFPAVFHPFRFGLQCCHFFHIFFRNPTRFQFFFPEIGQGLFLHSLRLCTLINPFFLRSDISHPEIWDWTALSDRNLRLRGGCLRLPRAIVSLAPPVIILLRKKSPFHQICWPQIIQKREIVVRPQLKDKCKPEPNLRSFNLI